MSRWRFSQKGWGMGNMFVMLSTSTSSDLMMTVACKYYVFVRWQFSPPCSLFQSYTLNSFENKIMSRYHSQKDTAGVTLFCATSRQQCVGILLPEQTPDWILTLVHEIPSKDLIGTPLWEHGVTCSLTFLFNQRPQKRRNFRVWSFSQLTFKIFKNSASMPHSTNWAKGKRKREQLTRFFGVLLFPQEKHDQDDYQHNQNNACHNSSDHSKIWAPWKTRKENYGSLINEK